MRHRALEPKFSWRGLVLITIAFALIGLAVLLRSGNTHDVTVSNMQAVHTPPDLRPLFGSFAFGALLVVAMLLGAWFGYLHLLRRAQSQPSKDKFKLVTEYPITDYQCGARAGDRVRLQHDISIQDHTGKPTGEVHLAGEIWLVLRGAAEEPVVVWLRQANGETHTWSDDEDFLRTFEILPRETT
jgi:hypothetical protein